MRWRAIVNFRLCQMPRVEIDDRARTNHGRLHSQFVQLPDKVFTERQAMQADQMLTRLSAIDEAGQIALEKFCHRRLELRFIRRLVGQDALINHLVEEDLFRFLAHLFYIVGIEEAFAMDEAIPMILR